MKVREIMKKPIVAEPEISVKEIAEIMAKNKIGSVILVARKKVVGIITESDLVNKFIVSDKLPSQVKAKDIMSSDVVTIPDNENVEYAAYTMAKKGIEHLPVITKGRLVGILTANDILRATPELSMNGLF